MSAEIEIIQDREYDEPSNEIGSPTPVFWARGHGFDEREFIRAVLDYCLDNDVDIPAISTDAEIVETWQQNISHDGSIEYRRDRTPPASSRSSRFPITLLDVSRRLNGGTRCSVNDCDEPWSVGAPVRVAVEPSDGDGPYMAVRLWLCREHRGRLPEPSYRVCLVPVGAEIVLPESAAQAGAR